MIVGRRCCLIFPWLGFVLVSLTTGLRADEPKSSPKAVFDCGTIALFHLLRWEGHPVDLQKLSASLPPCPVEGYSMKELRDAARQFGVKLEGVQLTAGDQSPDRPAIAFLKNGDHGHYVVVRPVGHTGCLVQVADLDSSPSVVEASKLYATPNWTGMVLRGDSSSRYGQVFQGIVVFVSIVSAALLIKIWKRRAKLLA